MTSVSLSPSAISTPQPTPCWIVLWSCISSFRISPFVNCNGSLTDRRSQERAVRPRYLVVLLVGEGDGSSRRHGANVIRHCWRDAGCHVEDGPPERYCQTWPPRLPPTEGILERLKSPPNRKTDTNGSLITLVQVTSRYDIYTKCAPLRILYDGKPTRFFHTVPIGASIS